MSTSDRERILRRVKSMREDYKQLARDEQRKEEVLEALRGLVEVAERLEWPTRYPDRVKQN